MLGAQKMAFQVAVSGWRSALSAVNTVLAVLLGACSSPPLVPFTTETPPLVLTPATEAGVQDRRGRFREVYCAVLQARAAETPDYMACDKAITTLAGEPPGSEQPVALGESTRRLV